jgi:hypothetical protein
MFLLERSLGTLPIYCFETYEEGGPTTNLEHHVREKSTASGLDGLFAQINSNHQARWKPMHYM